MISFLSAHGERLIKSGHIKSFILKNNNHTYVYCTDLHESLLNTVALAIEAYFNIGENVEKIKRIVNTINKINIPQLHLKHTDIFYLINIFGLKLNIIGILPKNKTDEEKLKTKIFLNIFINIFNEYDIEEYISSNIDIINNGILNKNLSNFTAYLKDSYEGINKTYPKIISDLKKRIADYNSDVEKIETMSNEELIIFNEQRKKVGNKAKTRKQLIIMKEYDMHRQLVEYLNEFYFKSFPYLNQYNNLNLQKVTKSVSSWSYLNQENTNEQIFSELDNLEIDINCYLYQYYIKKDYIDLSSTSTNESDIIKNFKKFYFRNDNDINQTYKCIKNDIIRLKRASTFGNNLNLSNYPIIFNFFTRNTPIINWNLQYLTYFNIGDNIKYERSGIFTNSKIIPPKKINNEEYIKLLIKENDDLVFALFFNDQDPGDFPNRDQFKKLYNSKENLDNIKQLKILYKLFKFRKEQNFFDNYIKLIDTIINLNHYIEVIEDLTSKDLTIIDEYSDIIADIKTLNNINFNVIISKYQKTSRIEPITDNETLEIFINYIAIGLNSDMDALITNNEPLTENNIILLLFCSPVHKKWVSKKIVRDHNRIDNNTLQMQKYFRKHLCIKTSDNSGCIDFITSIEYNNNCKNKYLKYKQKYLTLKNILKKNKYVNL